METVLQAIQPAGYADCSLCSQGDDDDDGVCNENDNCPQHANPDQEDCDVDGNGDACDSTPRPIEICNDENDNDCDGSIDCEDTDCASSTDCQPSDFHPCDQSPYCGCGDSTCEDNRIEICEALSYVEAWKRGDHDDISKVVGALSLWKTGECYSWDESTGDWVTKPCG